MKSRSAGLPDERSQAMGAFQLPWALTHMAGGGFLIVIVNFIVDPSA